MESSVNFSSPLHNEKGLSSSSLFNRLDWLALLSFIFPFGLYAITLAPTIYNLDSAELTTAAATGGIVRATGYPLYLSLGWLWSLLPIGDVGYRLNLFSAFCGALTILLLELSLRRLQVGKWARLTALGFLAIAPYFWAMSLVAEVYTLHTVLMAGIIFVLLCWAEHPEPRYLALAVFLIALSMGNHAATLLLLPGFAWFVLTRAPKETLQPRTWRLLLPAALLGASIYLYIPLRYLAQPAFNYAGHYNAQGNFVPVNLLSIDGFLWLVSGQSFANQMFGYQWHELWPQVTAYAHELWQAFFGLGIGPGLLGLALLLRRKVSLGGMLLLIFLANVFFYVNYRVVDKSTMYLPTYVVWALWAGVGLETIFTWLRGTILTQPTRLFIVAMLLSAAVGNWHRVDRSHDWSTREQSEAILQSIEPNAIVLGWWDTIPGIQYLQLVEGQRPDVLTINRFLISGEDMNRLIEREATKRPIYINSPSPALLQKMDVSPVGGLYRIQPKDRIDQ